MIISKIQETPNPNALQFYFKRPVLNGDTGEYTMEDLDKAKAQSNLAASLLQLDDIERVFFGSAGQTDFLTVTKRPEASWEMLKKPLALIILGFFEKETFVFKNSPFDKTNENVRADILERYKNRPDFSEIGQNLQRVVVILDWLARERVASHGGRIELVDFRPGDNQTPPELDIRLNGACMGCASTGKTSGFIEQVLKEKSGYPNLVLNDISAGPDQLVKLTMKPQLG